MAGLWQALRRLWDGDLQRRLLVAAALVVLAALPFLLLMPLFDAPFERDQGAYATIARGWLQGAIPYRDLWDNKGPLLYLWFAAAFRWLGETVVAPRLLAALAAAASVPFVWAAALKLLGRRQALLAAALFSLSFANLWLQATANSEIFMLLPLTAGLWAFTLGAGRGNLAWFALAGVLTGLAALTKQSAAWALIGYGVWLGVLALRNPGERNRHLAATAFLTAGAFLGIAPFAGYFYYHDALYDLWYATIAFNLAFAAQFPLFLKFIPPLLWHPLPLLGGLALWFLALLGAVHLWRRGDRVAWLILTFLIFSEFAAQALGNNAAHYNVQLLPGAALAGAVGLQVVLDRWRAGQPRLARILLACLAVTVAASAFVYAWPTPQERFLAQHGFLDRAYDSVRAPEIARTVDLLTEPGDYIYEFGRQSDIYFLADRQPATRWLHNRPYPVDPSIMEEILADLEEKQPPLILLTFECQPFAEEFPGCEAGPPAALKAYLDRHYRYLGRVEYADFYLRLGERGPSSARWGRSITLAAGSPG